MKKILLGSVFGLTIASSAMAADLSYPVKAPAVAVAPAFSWTGFYLGANAGGGWGEFDSWEGKYNEGGLTSSESWSHSAGGFIGGGQIGYNYQFDNNWVVGVEADFQWSGVKAEYSEAGYKEGVKVDWFGTIRARLGYAWDNFLLYGTGGVAYGKIEQYEDWPGGSASDDDTKWGWTAGVGAEYAFAHNWTLKAEYLYVDLGSISKSNFYNAPSYVPNYTREADVNFHTLKVGVNYKF